MRTKRPRGRPRVEDRAVTTTVRIPSSLRARAQAAADSDGVDLAEWIREAMERHLEPVP